MNKDKKTTIYCGYTVCIEYSENLIIIIRLILQLWLYKELTLKPWWQSRLKYSFMISLGRSVGWPLAGTGIGVGYNAGQVADKGDSQHRRLALGMWNITYLVGKELELVWEVEQYQLEIVGLTSTHRFGSGTRPPQAKSQWSTLWSYQQTAAVCFGHSC